MRNVDMHVIEVRGREILAGISDFGCDCSCYREELKAFDLSSASMEEAQSWLAVVEALRAAAMGNFGVGAALFRSDGSLVHSDCNHVFHPRFNSSAHAEMVVLDHVEAEDIAREPASGLTLVTSLESCPMCLSRIICAQIGTLLHVVEDEEGGMVTRRSDLPPVWRKLYGKMDIRRSECSDWLRTLSLAILKTSADRLNHRLMDR